MFKTELPKKKVFNPSPYEWCGHSNNNKPELNKTNEQKEFLNGDEDQTLSEIESVFRSDGPTTLNALIPTGCRQAQDRTNTKDLHVYQFHAT